MAKNRIQKIQLSEENKKSLVTKIEDMIQQAKELHGSYEQLHNIYLNQYLCKPDVEEKGWPWPGASNLVVPLGRVMQDGIMSQLHDAMFSNDPYIKVDAVESNVRREAEMHSLFYGEYVAKQILHLPILGNQWNFLTCLDGTGVVKHRWDNSPIVRRKIVPRLEAKYKEAVLDLEDGTKYQELDDYDEYYEEEITVSKANAPSVCLTDMSNIFIAPDTLPATDGLSGFQHPNCPWYYERIWMSEETLRSRRDIYTGLDTVIPSLKPRETTENERDARDYEGLNQSTTGNAVEVLEFYARMVLPAKILTEEGYKDQYFDDESGYPEEVIITYAPETKTVMRVVPLQRVYADGRRPHIGNYYNQIPFSAYGQGIQAKCRMLNAATNSSFNMMIDGGHIANVPWFFYQPSLTGILPEINSLMPGQGIPVNDPRGIQFPRFNSDQSWFLEVVQQIQQFAERDSNVTDFTLGRSPEKSATKTARGTIALLQQGSIAFGRLASLMTLAYEELFRAIHADYQRNMPNEVQFKTKAGGSQYQNLVMTHGLLNQEVSFQFVINPNKQQLIQNMQAMLQMFMQIPNVAQNPNGMRVLCKQYYQQSGLKNFDDVWPEQQIPQIGGMPPQIGQPPPQGQIRPPGVNIPGMGEAGQIGAEELGVSIQ